MGIMENIMETLGIGVNTMPEAATAEQECRESRHLAVTGKRLELCDLWLGGVAVGGGSGASKGGVRVWGI